MLCPGLQHPAALTAFLRGDSGTVTQVEGAMRGPGDPGAAQIKNTVFDLQQVESVYVKPKGLTIYLLEKTVYQWTREVQIPVVQGSTGF